MVTPFTVAVRNGVSRGDSNEVGRSTKLSGRGGEEEMEEAIVSWRGDDGRQRGGRPT